MNDLENKSAKNKSLAASCFPVQQSAENKSTFQLQDNRPESIIQKKQVEALANHSPVRVTIQQKTNNTGLPDNIKTGIENLSGHSMDDVKVHYHSSQPAQLNAHAYAQGTDIHIAPGQEKHLPHEAWHVVQQKQGRVKPTMQMKGKVNINDDKGLEKEADEMGTKALKMRSNDPVAANLPGTIQNKNNNSIASYRLNTSHLLQRRKIDIDEKENDCGDDAIADMVIKALGIEADAKERIIELIDIAYPVGGKVHKLKDLVNFVHYDLTKGDTGPQQKFSIAAGFTGLANLSEAAAIAAIREAFGDDLSPDKIYPWLLNDKMVLDDSKFRLWGYIKKQFKLDSWPTPQKWVKSDKSKRILEEEAERKKEQERQIEKQIAIMTLLEDKSILSSKDPGVKGAFSGLPNEVFSKIFAFVEHVVKTRHAPADQHVLVPEYPQFLARLRLVNKYFRLLIDNYNAHPNRSHIAKGISDARRMGSVLSSYFRGIGLIVTELVQAYPPDKNCFISLGGSPTPVAIALEKFPGDIKADVYHLPLGDIKGTVDGWVKESQQKWNVLAKHISRFLPNEDALKGRNIVVIDYVSMGIAINTVTRILRTYYPNTKVFGAGLMSSSSSKTGLGEGVQPHDLSGRLGKAMNDKTFKIAGLRTTASITLRQVLDSKEGELVIKVNYGALLKMLAVLSNMYADDTRK